ncbi:ester cyclase [Candidatus Albibeggiatoa sp. nov. NOAA]|uniref:ester cyclase n=1 Tax=Candidatus Albibeggiatoa sp. nov. NOAA TaxID=3162724 RepID=UPI0033053C23|nr:ester cyclase [Thiotrichaceae bacterium]
MTPVKIEQLLTQYYASWSTGNPDNVIQFFTQDAVFEDLAFEAKFVGLDAIRSFAVLTYSGVPDFKVVPTQIVAGDNSAAASWVMSGTHTGDLPNLPASQKRFEVRASSIITLKDDLIFDIKDYWNPNSFLK